MHLAQRELPSPAAPPPVLPDAPGRLAFVDNLRVFIIMMVLTHHAGNPYGGDPPDFWYFDDQVPHSHAVSLCTMLNPSFTMAVLLIFSGYLLPSSYDRRTFGPYVRDKFIRLGIPLVFGALVMLPLLQYTYHLNFGYRRYASFWDYYWQAWHGLGPKPPGWNGPGWPDRNLAHLWYIEHLFFYAVLYGLWRRFAVSPGETKVIPRPAPRMAAIFLFALAVSLATFAVRIFCPLHKVYALFGFLQIDMSHFPQWLPFFFVGILAHRYQWLTTLPKSTGMAWLAITIVLVAFYFVFGFSRWGAMWWFDAEGRANVGFNLACLTKSVWESFFCVGAAIGLIVLFREKLNRQGRLAIILAGSAYAVHVFHPPLIVGLQYLMAHVPLSVFAKYVVVSLLGIPLCYAAAHYVILRLPFARRIL